jgi:hypothetical protein
MTTKKLPAANTGAIVEKQEPVAIFEEVERFEDLGPRMYELLSTTPKGTRIYLRVRGAARPNS